MQGVIFSKREAQDPKSRKKIGKLTVETPDGRFFWLKVKTDHMFYELYKQCEIGMTVEWEGTTHFAIIKRGGISDES